MPAINPEYDKIIFIDIETVPLYPSFDTMQEEEKEYFESKNRSLLKNTDDKVEDLYDMRAGIQAEFGKIVCISIGYITKLGDKKEAKTKSYYGEDEKELLLDFSRDISKFAEDWVLCGHNIKEFDVPYMARRMIIDKVPLPTCLQLWGKKPWEVSIIDTMEMWKFGDWKNFTSLKLLTHILGVPSPKTDIDGSQVAKVFYEEKDVERIRRYCERDVLATMQVYLRLNNLDLIEEKHWTKNWN